MGSEVHLIFRFEFAKPGRQGGWGLGRVGVQTGGAYLTPGERPAAGDPQRHRGAICFDGGGRAVAAGGVVDQAGDQGREDRARQAATERAA